MANTDDLVTAHHGAQVHCMLIYGAVLHSSNEPTELSQWPCGHDDSTINTVMGIIIIMTSDDLRCVQGLKVTHK